MLIDDKTVYTPNEVREHRNDTVFQNFEEIPEHQVSDKILKDVSEIVQTNGTYLYQSVLGFCEAITKELDERYHFKLGYSYRLGNHSVPEIVGGDTSTFYTYITQVLEAFGWSCIVSGDTEECTIYFSPLHTTTNQDIKKKIAENVDSFALPAYEKILYLMGKNKFQFTTNDLSNFEDDIRSEGYDEEFFNLVVARIQEKLDPSQWTFSVLPFDSNSRYQYQATETNTSP